MNETLNTAVLQEPEEFEPDLRNKLATLFLCWKTMLRCWLASAVSEWQCW